MSYKDSDGIWQAGRPPLDLADQPPAKRKAAGQSPAKRKGLSLAELADSAPGRAWMTQAQVVAALNLDDWALYDDAELVGSGRFSAEFGEILFDAKVVAQRLTKPDENATAKAAADALLAEFDVQGIETGSFGGDAA